MTVAATGPDTTRTNTHSNRPSGKTWCTDTREKYIPP